MADVAKENSIEHLVYSSVANADKDTGISHFESKYKVEHHDGSVTWADATAVRGAIRVSDDPDWPLRHPRFTGVIRFD